MKYFLMIIFISSCSFSKKNAEIVDTPKDKSYYVSHNDCSISNEELEKEKWIYDRPYKKIEKLFSKRKPSSSDDLSEIIGKGCDYLDQTEVNQLTRISEDFGYNLISPMSYPETVDGLQTYLDDVGGIFNFNAGEFVAPNHPSVARSCGFDFLLPTQCRWASGATLGLIAQKFRDLINEENSGSTRIVRIRNWYRPYCYNSHSTVGGSDESDHRWSRAFDIDFPTAEDRAKAQRFLCQYYKDNPFNLSVGVGCRTLHVGIASHNGSRFWVYPSLNDCGGLKRLEGDDCWRITSRGTKVIHTDSSSTGGL